MAYETWVGPTYVSGLAGEVGVSVALVSLLTAVPWIGSVGQLLGVWAYRKVPSPKTYTLRVASAARSLWILPVLFATYWGWRAHSGTSPFPTRSWFTLLAVVACAASLLGASSAASWMSWVRGLVPENFRGRFFGVRQRFVMAALICANLVASFFIDWRPGGFRAGYLLIGILALGSALASTFLLGMVPIRTPDTSPAQGTPRAEGSVVETLLEPLRNREFRRLVVFGAVFNGAVQLGGAYFPYYFTKDLHLSMSQVALWTVIANAGWFVAAGFWGKRIDRTGNPKSVIWVTSHLIAISPLFYITPSTTFVRWIAPFDYFTNGAFWAGFSLAWTMLLLNACPKDRNTSYFSVYAAAAGLTGASGTLLGGQLARLLASVGGFRALWIIAGVARLSVAAFLFKGLYPERSYRLRWPKWASTQPTST